MNRSLLLIVGSPFTAWLPLFLGAKKSINRSTKIVLHPVTIGVIGLFFCAVISSVYNRDGLSFLASFVFVLYFFLIHWVRDELLSFERIHRLLRALWVISLMPALWGILEKMISTQIEMTWMVKLFWNPTYFPTVENYRIMSTFGNPNVAGDWFGMMSLLSFYFLEHCDYNKKRLIISGNILFLCNLILTGSKGAMTAYMLSTFVFAMLKHSKNTWRFLIFFSGLSALGIMMFFNLFETYNSRDLIWQGCIEIIKKSPMFGCGLLGIYPRIHEVHGHNLLISISASLGVLGLSITLYLLAYIVRTLWQLNRNKVRMAPILTSLQVFLLAHSTVDFTILAPQIGIIFFGICGLITHFGAVFLNQKYPSIHLNLKRIRRGLILKPRRSTY
ncbi:O-antigen ligase family protein [Fusibacter ferrireducens]|uniref:O-antigen ligase family protein n=1 Tax=Fusibacter ferrireducens TaxID=2785058 RepID=A0ABS0A0P3_9FIRM|nr:O-antigen ligase family protein [Fusibacter ferrireducens]MBF4695715.1 O-antigen ligase family protein [Fusibacter ferrireducens]